MSNFEKRNGTGVLFINKKKTTDKQPNFIGNIVTPEGKEYRIAGWSKESPKGKYISISVKEPEEKKDDFPF